LQNLPKDQQECLQAIFNSRDVSQDSFDALIKRASNQPSGNPLADSLFSKEGIARLSTGSGAEKLQLKEAAILLGKHLDGTLKHPPELIGKFLAAPASAANSLSEMARNTLANSEQVEAAIKEVSAISDLELARDRAFRHFGLASRDINLYKEISKVQDATLKINLLEAATKSPAESNSLQRFEDKNRRELLTNDQFKQITEAFSSSKEMATVIETLFADAASKVNAPKTIKSILQTKLEDTEVSMLSKALTTKTIEFNQIEKILAEDSATRNSLLSLASSGRATAADLKLFFALTEERAHIDTSLVDPKAPGEAHTLAEIEDRRARQLAAESKSADRRHRDNISIILKSAQLEPGEFGVLLQDRMSAFERSLMSDPSLHSDPKVVAKQKEFLDVAMELSKKLPQDNVEALEAISDLREYIRGKVPVEMNQMHLGEKVLAARLSHLEWLNENSDNYTSKEIAQLMQNRILLAAHASGLRNHPAINSQEQLVVFAHGCLSSDAAKFLEQQGKAFNLTGGRQFKAFFATPEIGTADIFAVRAIGKNPTIKDQTPRLIGFVLPAKTVAKLNTDKTYIQKPVPDHPWLREDVFDLGALERLSKEAYFFPLDEPLVKPKTK
jgi:hypothetical protein